MRSRRMRRMAITALAGVVATVAAGCQSGMPPKRTLAASEPPLTLPGDPEPKLVAEGARATKSVDFVDRHPLLSKPREVYQNSGNNKVVKVAGATLVGIPLGIFGELKQIVIGAPKQGY